MVRRFRLVDVFGERPLKGNPLPVVVDSVGLSTEDMLEITRWFDFSETTFLEPARIDGADYRVRIFSLSGELPFAGHPTLGTCHVWASLHDSPAEHFVQECGAGLVRIRRSGSRLAFAAPPLIREGPVAPDELARFAAVLGVDRSEIVASRWLDNGPGWVGILLGDAELVLGVQPDAGLLQAGEKTDIGLAGMWPQGSETAYEVRAFFTNQRGELVEDPVTGSLNASLAQWLIAEGRVKAPYLASQGTALGRAGSIAIDADDDGVWVGGTVHDIVEGHLVDLFS